MDPSTEQYLSSIIRKRVKNTRPLQLNSSLLNSQHYSSNAHRQKQNVRVHTLYQTHYRQNIAQSKVSKAPIEYMAISRRMREGPQDSHNLSILNATKCEHNVTFAKRKGLRIFEHNSNKKENNVAIKEQKRRLRIFGQR